jgi:hypothetical protein
LLYIITHSDTIVQIYLQNIIMSSDTKHPTRLDSLSKDGTSLVEYAVEGSDNEYLANYPLLVDKTPEELKQLEKSLLRRLDYIFLPMMTMVLFMG